MNRIVENIPDEKMQAFDEAMRILGIERTNEAQNDIPEWHKKIVTERMANYKEEDGIPWDEAMKNIRIK